MKKPSEKHTIQYLLNPAPDNTSNSGLPDSTPIKASNAASSSTLSSLPTPSPDHANTPTAISSTNHIKLTLPAPAVVQGRKRRTHFRSMTYFGSIENYAHIPPALTPDAIRAALASRPRKKQRMNDHPKRPPPGL